MSRSEGSNRFEVDFEGLELLGMFRVGKELDSGGMGSVYLGENTNLGTKVVVKVPHARLLAEKGFRQRFEREIKQLISVTHPHIVSILAQGVHDDVPYFVLSHLGGGSLADRLKAGGPETVEEVLSWAPHVGEALDFIHAQGVVHRDVKPANILFDDHRHVYLSDFGIAKAIGDAEVDATRLTTTGAGIGSPAYMAPEQGLGLELVPTTDQYALAATIYEALGGRPPFEGGTPMQLLVRKSQEAPPHLSTRRPAIPRSACDAVMRALDKDPAKRFPTCIDFVRALAATATAKPMTAAKTGAARTRAVPPGEAPRRVEPRTPPAAATSGSGMAGRLVVGLLLLAAVAAGLHVTGVFDKSPSKTDAAGTGSGAPPGVPRHTEPPPIVSDWQIDEAKRLGVPVAVENDIGMRFVLIPAEEFEMGSPASEKDRDSDETQHRVRLTKAYYMSIHEVTNSEYRRSKSSHDSGEYKDESLNGGRQPVVSVSHTDAVAYAAWLSGRERGRTYRLPTEAEWEYACRAGSTTPFWWGESEAEGHRHANANDPVTKKQFDFGHDGWPSDDGHRVSAPVGSYPPNSVGLYDMAGNVWEWCAEWYDKAYYEASPRTDPKGPTSGTSRVLRGGSWYDLPRYVRSATRGRGTPLERSVNYGFRLVLSLP